MHPNAFQSTAATQCDDNNDSRMDTFANGVAPPYHCSTVMAEASYTAFKSERRARTGADRGTNEGDEAKWRLRGSPRPIGLPL